MLNKIDLPAADPLRVKEDREHHRSARYGRPEDLRQNGINIHAVLEDGAERARSHRRRGRAAEGADLRQPVRRLPGAWWSTSASWRAA